jgi:hypothetical protein
MDATCAQSGYATPVRRYTSIDRRTRAWRRRCELIQLYTEQLGHEAQAKLSEIERVAELAVVAEGWRTKALAGESVDVIDLARIENTVARALWALGIGRRKRQDLGPAPLDYTKSLGGASDG